MLNKELKLYTIFNLTLSILILIIVLIFPMIGVDAGYYLSIGRDFYQKTIGLYDINNSYNPLAFLIYAIPYKFSDNPYFSSIIILIIINLINTFLFYKTLISLKIKSDILIVFTSLFLLYSLFLESYYLLLEPVQILFTLISLLFLLNKKYFLSGMFIFLSFYSKQYSLAILPAYFYYIYYVNNKSTFIKKSILLILGFVTGLLIAYFIFANHLSFTTFFKKIIGIYSNTVNVENNNFRGSGYTFKMLVQVTFLTIIICPFIYIWIPLLFYKFKKIKD